MRPQREVIKQAWLQKTCRKILQFMGSMLMGEISVNELSKESPVPANHRGAEGAHAHANVETQLGTVHQKSVMFRGL